MKPYMEVIIRIDLVKLHDRRNTLDMAIKQEPTEMIETFDLKIIGDIKKLRIRRS